MSVLPKFTPESDDTRWKLQQGFIFAAGAAFAVAVSGLTFLLAKEDGAGAGIAWFRAQIAFLLAGWPAMQFYKIIKRDRIIRAAEAKVAKLAADNLALTRQMFDMAMDLAKMRPNAAPTSTDTADVFVGIEPNEGQHLAGERQKMNPAELMEYVKAKHKAGLLTVSEIDALLKPIKGSEAFKSVRMWLLTRRGELVDKEEPTRTVEL